MVEDLVELEQKKENNNYKTFKIKIMTNNENFLNETS